MEKKALLAEDNGKHLDEALRILHKYGYYVHCVDMGSVALEYCKENKYDLYVLDIVLKFEQPDISGLNIADKVREKDKEVPIIINSDISKDGIQMSQRVTKLNAKCSMKNPEKLEELVKFCSETK